MSVNPEAGADLCAQFIPNFRGMNILTPVVHGAVAGNEIFIRELTAITAYRWNGTPAAATAK